LISKSPLTIRLVELLAMSSLVIVQVALSPAANVMPLQPE
jgi:hypothetical protein